MSDRLPPQSRDAERLVLGCVMNYPAKLEEVRDILAVEDFYFDAHRRIYAAILRLHDRHQPFDMLFVIDDLRSKQELADCGGDVYIAELGENAAIASDQYVQIIKEKALLRALIRSAIDVVNDAYTGSAPAEEILDKAQAEFGQLASRGTGPGAVPIVEVVDRALDLIDARTRGEVSPGLPTGFADLDEILCGGLGMSQLTTLAARPSVGKTTLSMQFVRNACEAGKSVLFVSLEQPEQELSERILASVSGVAGNRIRQGKFRAGDSEKLSDAADLIRRWRLQIADRPAQAARQIATAARRARRRAGGLDLIVVDYLGLVEPENRKANRNEQVGSSARRIRDMARELKVPVLLVCQLNRDAAGGNKAPQLHQLRDSGEIEQVSDAVFLLHRTGRGTDGTDRIQVQVAKQRNGPLAIVEFVHETAVYTFREVGIET